MQRWFMYGRNRALGMRQLPGRSDAVTQQQSRTQTGEGVIHVSEQSRSTLNSACSSVEETLDVLAFQRLALLR